jgi:flagellin
MSLNSVNTNMGAMVALQSLEATQQQLSATQKEISTGYRVADSTDDGAAYAIAQGVRSNVGALTSANQQLGTATGLLTTTQTALNNVSNPMTTMRGILTNLQNTGLTSAQITDYTTQYSALLATVKNDIVGSTYNGKSLIGDMTGTNGIAGQASSISMAIDESGNTYGVAAMSGTAIYGALSFGASTLGNAASVGSFLTAGGTFATWSNKVATDLNTIGSSINFVASQTTYNNNKIDSLNSGLGSLIDADLAKESAQLTALQIRQQLGTQALSLANQAPQSLLSLFK